MVMGMHMTFPYFCLLCYHLCNVEVADGHPTCNGLFLKKENAVSIQLEPVLCWNVSCSRASVGFGPALTLLLLQDSLSKSGKYFVCLRDSLA